MDGFDGLSEHGWPLFSIAFGEGLWEETSTTFYENRGN